MTTLGPIHPGEVLLEEFLEPLGVSHNRLAVAIDVSPRRINEIAHGRRRITADTALRLARYSGPATGRRRSPARTHERGRPRTAAIAA